MTIKSVCSSSFRPEPKKKSGVFLNGLRTIAINSKVRENPYITRCLKSRAVIGSVVFPCIGLRHIHDSNESHTTHIRMGPSRAAQVAAKRYLNGNDSPPKATTYCIEVSLTINLLTRAKNGNARQTWAAIAPSTDLSYKEG